jgi:chromosomal replication initiation ATPase DnaA
MTSGPRASRWRQLGLALPHEPHYSGADFLVSQSNVAALRMIESWPQWPDKVLLLVGAPGSGKSHLSAIWAAQAGAESLSSGHLAGSDMAELAALAAKPALVIDDADALGGAEAPLFHLLNLARQEGQSLLLTARRPPDLWGLATPDLLSRLRLAPVVELGAPDDELLRAVLQKLFRDRQLLVDAPVIDYIALHTDRSLDVARAVVEALDQIALARGGAITRALARELLADAADEAE